MVVQNSLSTHPGTPANTLAYTHTHTHTPRVDTHRLADTHGSGPELCFWPTNVKGPKLRVLPFLRHVLLMFTPVHT